jgi:hypothetical protein
VKSLNFYHFFSIFKKVKWLFNKNISKKNPKESFLPIYEVKNDSNYAFLSKPDVNPKSGSDLKSKIRFQSGSKKKS